MQYVTTMRRWRRGFTLIELLVVIAIIAILAGILFPVFAKARERGKMAACLSNCKQIGLGLNMYTEDHDENFFANPWPESKLGFKFWVEALYPYTRSSEIYACPSEVRRPVQNQVGRGKYNIANYRIDTKLFDNIGYGFNEYIIGWGGTFTYDGRATGLRKIKDPAGIAIFGDSTAAWGSYVTRVLTPGVNAGDPTVAKAGELYWTWSTPGSTSWEYGKTRHLEGSTFVYADGHAGWSKPAKFSSGGNDYQYGYYPKARVN